MTTIRANGSFSSGGHTTYNARYGQAEFRNIVDLLRHEKPVFFQWNESSKRAMLSTGKESVGEDEVP